LSKTKILDEAIKSLDMEALYKDPEFQQKIAEVVLVVQTLPRKGKLTWPKVPDETHGPAWFQTVPHAREADAVLKVWNQQNDQPVLRMVGNQILQACEEVNIEKALFWLKWILDEDKRIRNQGAGYTLTTARRTGSGTMKADKAEIGYYLAAVLAEAYKDLARRNLVRMHEEFQMLSRMYMRDGNYFSARQRTDILVLMSQIICEVPRWKVPAAVPLAKDEKALGLAVAQAPIFFREVLLKPAVEEKIWKYARRRVAKPETKKEKSQEDQIDEIYKSFYKGIV
jgi:hypothetical protein